MRLGLGLCLSSTNAGANPEAAVSALALTGWWRTDFSASPWTSTASAGTSGGRVITEATNPPSVSAALNGHVGASFDGVNDWLSTPVLGASSFFSASAYSYVLLVKPTAGAAASAAGTPYLDQQFFCENGDLLGLSWTTTGVRAWHYDGTTFSGTALVACSADTVHCIEVTFGSGTLSTTVDNGTPATASKSNVASLTNVLRFARNSGSVFRAGIDYEILMANTVLSSGNLAVIRAYFNARYGTTFT